MEDTFIYDTSHIEYRRNVLYYAKRDYPLAYQEYMQKKKPEQRIYEYFYQQFGMIYMITPDTMLEDCLLMFQQRENQLKNEAQET